MSFLVFWLNRHHLIYHLPLQPQTLLRSIKWSSSLHIVVVDAFEVTWGGTALRRQSVLTGGRSLVHGLCETVVSIDWWLLVGLLLAGDVWGLVWEHLGGVDVRWWCGTHAQGIEHVVWALTALHFDGLLMNVVDGAIWRELVLTIICILSTQTVVPRCSNTLADHN